MEKKEKGDAEGGEGDKKKNKKGGGGAAGEKGEKGEGKGGKGKGPVQGQSYAARKKEQHKSAAANHRRKDRFAKKMGI